VALVAGGALVAAPGSAPRSRAPFLRGLPWNSTVEFGGLAFCLGGRSLYWRGWLPQYLDSEMHRTPVGSITADNLLPAECGTFSKACYW
jgi:hypothetical protein